MKKFRPRMTMPWIMSTLLLAGGSGLFILLMHRPLTGNNRAVAAESVEPPIALIASGHVDLEHGVVSLHARTPGQVVDIPVAENDEVPAGAVLVQLDDHTARLHLQQAQADLSAAEQKLAEAEKLPAQHEVRIEEQQAALAAAESKLEAAQLVLDRQHELAKRKLIDQMDEKAAAASEHQAEAMVQAEQARLREFRLSDPQADIAMARAARDARRIEVELARQAVADCRITAPSAGSVLRVLVAVGDMLGLPGQQTALLFCPAGKRIVRAEVAQEFAGRVDVGQAALIQDDALAGRTWHGKVVRVSDWFTQRRSIIQEPLQQNDVRTLECIVALDGGQPPLRIGQRVRVKIAEKEANAG